jgi:hypothetical protein
MCFFNSAEGAYLEESEPILTMKNLSSRKYPCAKHTEFSQGNNVLDAPACITLGYLLRDTCGSSSELNRPILNKTSFSL